MSRPHSLLQRRYALRVRPTIVESLASETPRMLDFAGDQPLSFSMQPVAQTEWCWAAVAASVSAFYTAASIWTQCAIANRVLANVRSGTDCCADGTSSECNQDWYLERALQCTVNLAEPPCGPIGFDRVKSEIAGGRPIGARFQWAGGIAAHFFTIYGYVDDDSQTVLTRDPTFADGSMPVSTLASSYLGMPGKWTNVYFTEGAP